MKMELTLSEVSLTIHALKTAIIADATTQANIRMAKSWRGDNETDNEEITELEQRIDEMNFLLTRYQLYENTLKPQS